MNQEDNNQTNAYDVIVVGVGAVGSSICYQLAKRGVRVLGLEQHAIPHALGGSHGYSRQTKIAPYIGSVYEKLILRSYELFRELIKESGEPDIMVTTGFLDVHRNRDFPAYKENHGHFEDLNLDQLKDRFPQFQLSAPYWAAYDPEGALLRPELTITTQVRLAMQHGARIYGNTEVLDWEAGADGASVKTDRGSFSADRVIFSAGAWTGTLLQSLDVCCTATRQSFGWVWPERDMEAYRADKMPCWCIDDDEGIYYGFPMMTDVPGYKIGLHWYGEPVDPSQFDRTPNADDEERIRKGLRKYFPDADGPLMGIRTCLYAQTPDEAPVIDIHPEHDRVVLCGPLAGAGFKFIPAYAEAAADLATSGDTNLPIDFMRINRLLK
jgi:sarcosine oxidase